MKAKSVGSYRNAKGTLVFVYALLSLSAAQKEEYKAAQGDNYREAGANDPRGLAEGTPLFFTTRTMGPVGTLAISSKGKVFADMSEYETTANLVAQFGGNFGDALAKAAAAKLLGGGAPAVEAAPVATPVSAASADLSNPE